MIKIETVCVVSDLKDYGAQDDGTPFIGEVFFVQAETRKGDRYRHYWSMPGVRVEEDEWGKAFIDTRDAARAALEVLAERAQKRGVIDPQYWQRDRPAYGSEAWIEYGEAEELAWERT